MVCSTCVFLTLKKGFLGISFILWETCSFISNVCEIIALCSWAFWCVVDFVGTYFTVLMINEWIDKVLVLLFKALNHKNEKLILNLQKARFTFKNMVLLYF